MWAAKVMYGRGPARNVECRVMSRFEIYKGNFTENPFYMENYNMLYEELVVAGWGKILPSEIPKGINAAAGLLSVVDDDLSGENGYEVKLGLSSAAIKSAVDNAENADVFQPLIELNKEIWSAKKYNDIIVVMKKMKTVFEEKLGKALIY
jgi:hypothetical protein